MSGCLPVAITAAQLQLLSQISRTGDHGCSQTALAKLFGVSRVSMGVHVRVLARMGLVVMVKVTTTRSGKCVRITSKGEHLIQCMAEADIFVENELIRERDSRDVECLTQVLAAVRDNLLEIERTR